MDRKTYEKEVAKLSDAIAKTDERIMLRSIDLQGDDYDAAGRAYRNRLRGMIRRMEQNNVERDAKIARLTARYITGYHTMTAFFNSLGEGPRHGYRPSLSREHFGEIAVNALCHAWGKRFDTEPYIY